MSSNITPINQPQSVLAYAKRYIALGYFVLPLLPGEKKPFSRLVPNGFLNATNDIDIATKWWTAEPTAGIGIALKASRLVAVDVDARNGGFQTLDDLQAKFGKIESDVMQLTGGGGWHIVYVASESMNLPGTLGKGIDLKADGYIAAEPSIHPNGTAYEWEASSSPLDGCIPSTLPGWIRDQSRAPVQALVFEDAPIAPTPRWLDALAALAHISSDERDTWLRVGMAIHNERPDSEGFSAWCTWSERSPKFNFADQSRVWASFRRRGISGATLNTVFAMAQNNGWRNAGNVVALPASMQDSAKRLVVDLAQLGEMSKNVSWQVKHTIPAQSIGVVFGASGTFKSFIALDLCLHIAHGLPWLGKKTKQGTVVYVAAEGGAGLMRRITAWHMKRNMALPLERFFVCPQAVTMNDAPQIERLRTDIEAVCQQPTLVVVDTMSQTFSGNENSNDEVAAFFNSIKANLMQPLGCGAMVIHHSGHEATDRTRGASAIKDNADYVFGVFREKDAMLARLECTKQKDGDKTDVANFELESCQLGIDEDGEAVTSLVSSFADTNGTKLVEAVTKQRNSAQAIFLSLVRETGQIEMVRKEFYKAFESETQDNKRKKFGRTQEALISMKLITIGDGGHVMIVDKSVDNLHEGDGNA